MQAFAVTPSYHDPRVMPVASDDFARENTHGDGDTNLQDEQDQEDAQESVKEILKDTATSVDRRETINSLNRYRCGCLPPHRFAYIHTVI